VNEVLVQIRAGPLSAADNEHRRESLDQNHVPSKPQIDTHHPLPSSMYLDAALSLSQRPNILGISSISLLVINGQPVLKAEVHVPSTLSAQEVCFGGSFEADFSIAGQLTLHSRTARTRESTRCKICAGRHSHQ